MARGWLSDPSLEPFARGTQRCVRSLALLSCGSTVSNEFCSWVCGNWLVIISLVFFLFFLFCFCQSVCVCLSLILSLYICLSFFSFIVLSQLPPLSYSFFLFLYIFLIPKKKICISQVFQIYPGFFLIQHQHSALLALALQINNWSALSKQAMHWSNAVEQTWSKSCQIQFNFMNISPLTWLAVKYSLYYVTV